MSVKIELNGVQKATKFINRKNKKMSRLIDSGVRKAAFFVHGEVKTSILRGTNASVAVDTGLFAGTVQVKPKGKDAIIFSNLSYAKYVEFGTTKMAPRPHFTNTKSKNKHKVLKILKEEIKKL